MSLNGLDDPAVIDAYQTALSEAGGWLLLKYASRDEVTLLGRGTGGVPDVRATVEGYEEKSPLYGFLQYRRRKIVLKYVPDGMSRLVQARTIVQFQSILDKFSPQDTTFEFKAPGDLTESALSSACLLHAVSGSITSSSSSLRRRRLMEIAEDSEEGPPTTSSGHSEAPQLPEDTNKDNNRLSQASDMTAVPEKPKANESANTPLVSENEMDTRSETASVRSVSRRRFLDQLQQDSFERRTSSQSMRPSLQELYYAAPYRQKVKTEHRPSADVNGRPRTAGSVSRSQEHRPTAALPAGVRSRKLSSASNRPKSTPDVPPVPTLASLRNAPPVPLLIPPPTLSIGKPKLSPGAKSMNALPSSGMSPEKQRLMKALELRKKQMEKKTQELQKRQAQKTLLAAEPVINEIVEEKETTEHPPTQDNATDPTPPETRDTTILKSPSPTTNIIEDTKPLSADIAKADSAVEMVTLASTDTECSISSIEIEQVADKETERTKGTDGVVKDLEPVLQAQTPPQDDTKEDATETTDGEQPAQNFEEEIVTPRTSDSDSTIKVSGYSDVDEQRKTNTDETGATQDPVVDITVLETAVETPETEEQSDTPQTADEEDQLELITIVASVSDLKPETQRLSSATSTLGEEVPKVENLPAATESANLQAENTPFPLESGGHLAGQLPTKAALETVSTVQEQPLPRPEQAEIEKSEKQKRLVLLEPIQVPTPDFSDDENLLSDDSLMEELTSATVQEAQPVSVGKGPLSPDGEPRTPLEAWQTRAVSNPSRRPNELGSLSGESRSISATFVDNNNQSVRPAPVMQAKKVNVSSGISKRIKALEMFSNNSAPSGNLAPPGNVTSPAASSAFEKFRKRASVSLNGNLPSATTTSVRSSFISVADPPPLNRPDSRSLPRTNSFSVTARIVRDPSSPPTERSDSPLDANVLGLQRSPLIVRHDSFDTQASEHVLSDSATELRSNNFSRPGTDTTVSRSESRTSLQSQVEDWSNRNGSAGDIGAISDDKKDSRRSRFMRRMSSLTSPSRKTLISPPPGIDKQRLPSPNEEQPARSAAAPAAIEIGEVNVQFPDTLLWKRRFLRIDDQGYLVLTPGSTDTGARNIVKRYHLSEFKTPCLPDEERQELPNSILLDFRDGSTLQCACESRKGQAAALQTLVNAHNAYQQ